MIRNMAVPIQCILRCLSCPTPTAFSDVSPKLCGLPSYVYCSPVNLEFAANISSMPHPFLDTPPLTPPPSAPLSKVSPLWLSKSCSSSVPKAPRVWVFFCCLRPFLPFAFVAFGCWLSISSCGWLWASQPRIDREFGDRLLHCFLLLLADCGGTFSV